MKFTVNILTVIPGETARSYVYFEEADSLDQAQIHLSRKLAHDWIEIFHENRLTNVRTSYIAATEIVEQEQPETESSERPQEEPGT